MQFCSCCYQYFWCARRFSRAKLEGIPPGRRSGSTSRRSVTPPSAAAKQMTPLDIERSMPDPCHLPDLSNVGGAPKIAAAEPEPCDQPLPINLASAMRLADARPLVIQAAMASEMTVAGRLDKAKVLWLPDVYLGADYQRHDGGAQRTTGDVAINDRNQFLAGGGLKAVFGLTDAIYAPLAVTGLPCQKLRHSNGKKRCASERYRCLFQRSTGAWDSCRL